MHGFITLALATLAAALPTTTPQLTTRAAQDSYRMYWGDGSSAAGWPAMHQWASFDELWNINAPVMKRTCGWNGYGAENSDAEIAAIKRAVLQLSGETGVDNRLILAVIMQESKGCVRARTTNNGVRNPGLMQSHNGSGTCEGVNPCPDWQITQMVRDGVAGTAHGDGLKQTLAKAMQRTNSRNGLAHFIAARMYNSGSVDYGNLNNGLGSTACYAADIANRLTGWILAPTQCWL